jgi:hypothetical protein
MIRTLKLSMALTALLALGAVGVSSAQAATSGLDVGTTPTHSAWLTGEQATQNKLIITSGTETVTVKCSTATFQATTADGTVNEATVTPGYGGVNACTLGGSFATVDINSCKYTLTDTLTSLVANADVVCPGTSKIEITSAGCTVTVGSQGPLGSVTFSNNAGPPEHVTATLAVKNIAVTGDAGCPANLVGAHNAELTGSITLKAFQDNAGGVEGTQVSLKAT